MRFVPFVVSASFALQFGSQCASADFVFSENFDPLNGGVGTLNFWGPSNWTVVGGTVDLIGNGFYDLHPGNGLYLDLDGSTGHGGTIVKTLSLGAGNYRLDFLLGGSRRGDTNIVEASFGSSAASYSVASAEALSQRSIVLTVSEASPIDISFRNLGGDNIGAILDAVSVATIPSGPTAAVTALGLSSLGRSRRRRDA